MRKNPASTAPVRRMRVDTAPNLSPVGWRVCRDVTLSGGTATWMPVADSKKYRVPSGRRTAASTRSQVVGSLSALPLNGWTGAGSAGAATGRHRKLPPLWSTLNQGPSSLSAGALNRTTRSGVMGVSAGSANSADRSAARGGGVTVAAGSAYSSGVSVNAAEWAVEPTV